MPCSSHPSSLLIIMCTHYLLHNFTYTYTCVCFYLKYRAEKTQVSPGAMTRRRKHSRGDFWGWRGSDGWTSTHNPPVGSDKEERRRHSRGSTRGQKKGKSTIFSLEACAAFRCIPLRAGLSSSLYTHTYISSHVHTIQTESVHVHVRVIPTQTWNVYWIADVNDWCSI